MSQSPNRFHHHPHPYNRDSHPPHKQSIRNKMAARLGKDASALGGVEVRGEGSHLSWVPGVRESPGEGGGSSRRAEAAAATAPLPGEAALQTCPPHALRPRLRPPSPAPVSNGRDHCWGGGWRKKRGWGGDLGHRKKKKMMKGLEGIVRVAAGNDSLSRSLPPSTRWTKGRH